MARKVTMWAKAAGEYYRKNKGKNGIESFADVLKSEEFKMEYENKYKNKGNAKTVGKKEKKSMRNAKTLKVGSDKASYMDLLLDYVDENVDNENTKQNIITYIEDNANNLDLKTMISTIKKIYNIDLSGYKNPQVENISGKNKSKKRTTKKSSYKLW